MYFYAARQPILDKEKKQNKDKDKDVDRDSSTKQGDLFVAAVKGMGENLQEFVKDWHSPKLSDSVAPAKFSGNFSDFDDFWKFLGLHFGGRGCTKMRFEKWCEK